MYYLKDKSSYYCSMIGGLIVEISDNASNAKVFASEEAAKKEIENNKVFLEGFEPVACRS